MKKLFLILFTGLLFFSCSHEEDEFPTGTSGSLRDWRYSADQVRFYIDGVQQTSVSEIEVRSSRREDSTNEFPMYNTTLKITGLPKKGKVFYITVVSSLETFEGKTLYQGVEYNVTGEFTGDPFEHYSKQGIIVNLTTFDDFEGV